METLEIRKLEAAICRAHASIAELEVKKLECHETLDRLEHNKKLQQEVISEKQKELDSSK